MFPEQRFAQIKGRIQHEFDRQRAYQSGGLMINQSCIGMLLCLSGPQFNLKLPELSGLLLTNGRPVLNSTEARSKSRYLCHAPTRAERLRSNMRCCPQTFPHTK